MPGELHQSFREDPSVLFSLSETGQFSQNAVSTLLTWPPASVDTAAERDKGISVFRVQIFPCVFSTLHQCQTKSTILMGALLVRSQKRGTCLEPEEGIRVSKYSFLKQKYLFIFGCIRSFLLHTQTLWCAVSVGSVRGLSCPEASGILRLPRWSKW